MRIVGGRLSGRRFGASKGLRTRPTSDRVREALASALDARGAFEGARVLDLFAGTGALGFEALSRGAADALLVDSSASTLRQIEKSARELGLEGVVQTARVDLLGEPASVVAKLPLEDGKLDLVFVDAPYAAIDRVPALLGAVANSGALSPGAWIVVERPASFEWTWPNGLAPEAEYRYGQTGVSLGVRELQKGTP